VKHVQRTTRLYVASIDADDQLPLGELDAHYLGNVLRLRVGDAVTAFDGQGREWRAEIHSLKRRRGMLKLIEPLTPLPESPLALTLVQALVKSEAMDSIVQKATELGVAVIRPVSTQWSVVRLDAARLHRKLDHWQRIARSACEQSGRHRPPLIHPPAPLADVLALSAHCDLRILLDPAANEPPAWPSSASSITVIVGPEGGFGPADVLLLEHAGCMHLRLGARVLRADTAAIAACALAQQRWGDLC